MGSGGERVCVHNMLVNAKLACGVHSSKASRRAEQQKIRKAAHYNRGVSKDFAFKVHGTTCIKIIQNEP